MKSNLKFPRVPYAMTVHDSKEITAVVNTLKTSTQMGAKTKEFEKKIAHLYSKKIGLAVNSGTSALYLAMESFNIKKGSEVITPALTFATTVGCILKNGLIPAFVDVDLNTLGMSPESLEMFLNDNTEIID